MSNSSDLEAARAELKAMRDRHKVEAQPLVSKINRLKQKALRDTDRTQRNHMTLAEKLAQGMIVYSRDPSEIAAGATPTWGMPLENRAYVVEQRAAKGFPPLDFTKPSGVDAAAPSAPQDALDAAEEQSAADEEAFQIWRAEHLSQIS